MVDKDLTKFDCVRCGETKKARRFINPKAPTGYGRVCIKCRGLEEEAHQLDKDANKLEREAYRMRVASKALKKGKQKCIECGEVKPLRGTYFKPSITNYTKRRPKCEECYKDSNNKKETK